MANTVNDAGSHVGGYDDGVTGIPAGGIPAYVQRLRKDHGMVWREPGGWWCKCGEPGCGKHYLLKHIEHCIAAYEAKVDDLRRETVRTSILRNVVWRLLHVIPRNDLDDVLADGFATPEEMAVLREINDRAPAPFPQHDHEPVEAGAPCRGCGVPEKEHE